MQNKELKAQKESVLRKNRALMLEKRISKKLAPKANVRQQNGHRRRQLRERVKAMGLECALCGQPIDYTLPAGHPWSYELDEIVPVSKGGDPLDIHNVQPAHRICNQKKSNKTPVQAKKEIKADKKIQAGEIVTSRNWLEQ